MPEETPSARVATPSILFSVLAVLSLLFSFSPTLARQPILRPVSFYNQAAQVPRISRADDLFIEDLERRSFQYFWEQGDPNTGLVPDRARMDRAPLAESHRNVASIAATGFSLTALCIAAERDWIDVKLEFIHEIVLDQRMCENTAAVEQNVLSRLPLQLTHCLDYVVANDGGIAPRIGGLERG